MVNKPKGRKLDKRIDKKEKEGAKRRESARALRIKEERIKKKQALKKEFDPVKAIYKGLFIILILIVFTLNLKDTRSVSQILNNGDEDLVMLDIIVNGPTNYVTVASIFDTVEIRSKDILSQEMLVYSKTKEEEFILTFYDVMGQDCLMLRDYLDTQKGYDLRSHGDNQYLAFKGGTIKKREADGFTDNTDVDKKVFDQQFELIEESGGSQ